MSEVFFQTTSTAGGFQDANKQSGKRHATERRLSDFTFIFIAPSLCE